MKNSTQRKIENNELSFDQIAEVEVTYLPHFKAQERPQINQSQTAYNIFVNNWNNATIEYKEDFKILLLNRSNRVLGIYHLASGGMSGVVVDTKVIFSIALKACASAIVLAHNHPSGNLQPSTEDKTITRRIQEAGKLLDINILDHIIITSEAYLSFADEGLM